MKGGQVSRQYHDDYVVGHNNGYKQGFRDGIEKVYRRLDVGKMSAKINKFTINTKGVETNMLVNLNDIEQWSHFLALAVIKHIKEDK